MQQAKQEAKEAQKAAAAKAYAERKGEVTEEKKVEKEPLSGNTSRPFSKGRAYDPNRYRNENTEE